jgi:hypothetical protein
MPANGLNSLPMLFAIFARAYIALQGHPQLRRQRLVSLHMDAAFYLPKAARLFFSTACWDGIVRIFTLWRRLYPTDTAGDGVLGSEAGVHYLSRLQEDRTGDDIGVDLGEEWWMAERLGREEENGEPAT